MLLAAVIAAYLVGAIPFGLLLSKALSDCDPRDIGSGNIGATNAMRAGGKKVGVLTLLADIGKSLLPVAVAIWMELPENWIAAIAAAAFVGHIFPVYLAFQGGKGVATMLGAMLPWQPVAALLGMVLWAVVMGLSRYVSLASIVAALALPLLIYLTGGSQPAMLVGGMFALLVTWKHSANITRLLAGTESSFGKKK